MTEIDENSKKSFNAAIWYIITNFISKSILYFCTPLYTRVLTSAEYGEYNNFLSWQNILIALLTFDLSAAVGIAYYDYEEEKDFEGFVSTITILSYLLPGILCAFMWIFNDFFSKIFTIKKEYLVILLIYVTFCNTLNIFQSEQRARLKYKISALVTLFTSFFTVIVTLVFICCLKNKLQGVLLGSVALNIVVNFFLTIVILRKSRRLKLKYAWYAIRIAVPLIPHVLAATLLGGSDKVMITKFCGTEATAFYGLSYTISMVVTMVASSINKAWTPWFYGRLKSNERSNIKIISNSVVLLIAVCSLFICLFAPEILLIVGGKSYVASAPVMPPIICACLINCVSTFYINIEFYNKKTAGISIATVISAVLNIILNYVFINRFGYIAAAYTTLFSSIVTLVFHIYKVKRQNMLDVFDNGFLILLIGIFLVISEVIIFTYKNLYLRCGIAIFCMFVFSVTLYKYRRYLNSFISIYGNKKKVDTR